MTFPIIMMCIGTAIMAFLVTYVVPQVATIFEQQKVALPPMTQVLLAYRVPIISILAGGTAGVAISISRYSS